MSLMAFDFDAHDSAPLTTPAKPPLSKGTLLLVSVPLYIQNKLYNRVHNAHGLAYIRLRFGGLLLEFYRILIS